MQHNAAETASVMGVEVEELQLRHASTSSLTKEDFDKIKDYDELLLNLRQKIVNSSSYHEKLQILTLAPYSWPREKVAEFFSVSEYLVRTARSLKDEIGILAIPEPKQGKKLTAKTEELVKVFFEDDEYTRLLPGKKDYVSIATNVHKQK